MRSLNCFPNRIMAVFISASCLFCSVTRGDEPALSLVGRWNLQVQGPNGEFPAWLEIRKSGVEALVGTYVGQFGSARPIGEITGDASGFRFSIPTQWERTPRPVVYEGKLVAGKLQGETNGGTDSTWKWSGTSAPKLDRQALSGWGPAEELFNGKDLDGWQPRFADRDNGWIVQDGILSNAKPGNDLLTEAKFTDFRLTVEFRYPPGSNSGVYLRGRYEVQIEDNFGQDPDSHGIGGIYGHLTPSSNASKPAGEWQTYEIELVGRKVSVILNGERVIDRQSIPGNTGGGLDNDEASPGPILLQGDHGPVDFRRITLHRPI